MNFDKPTRRDFLKGISMAAVSTEVLAKFNSVLGANRSMEQIEKKRPNIIIVLTDDQGYGDVGFHGNEIVKTPNLDQFAREGTDLTRFYVAPVCSPTRAGIMTGRYHYRTGVTNVGSCGDQIKKTEVTIAKALRDAGYATAIFGKWHLGDNYPIRPQDMGFEEAVIHKSCCLTPWFRNDPHGENYFDPFLFHNGVKKQYKGYCMDVYTDLAIDFAEKNNMQQKPFFIYLSTNTPHEPLNVGKEFSEPYKEIGLSDYYAKYFGTITNIDYNFGRLTTKLKELGLEENTMVIFLSDNGAAGGDMTGWPQKLRGKKASVYEGGIRVPCVFRWPDEFKGGTKIDRISAYIDLMPTALEAAGVAPPQGIKFDGISLLPLLKGQPENYLDRTIIIQWHQGLNPQMYRSFTVFNQRFKLVQAVGGFQRSGKYLIDEYKYELFDIAKDQLERNNVSSEHPEVVLEMKKQYEEWFWDVIKERGPDPQEIFIGSPHENPCRLMASGSFVEQDEIPNFGTGEWPSRVIKSGKYNIKMMFLKGLKSGGNLHFRFGDAKFDEIVEKGITECNLGDIYLENGCDWLEGYVSSNGKRIIPTYIDLEYLESP